MLHRIRTNRVSMGRPALAALLAIAVAASGLAACAAPGSAGPVVKADEVASAKPRAASGHAAAGSVPALVGGNNAFALDLYRQLFDSRENAFFSPHSLSVVLAMTYAGARGETGAQMAQALHFDLPQTELHPAFNALAQSLAGPPAGEGGTPQLRFANALWGQQGYTFLDPFLDTLAENYGAGMRLVDFGRAGEARARINGWAGEQTGGRIDELLPAGALNGETALVLTSAAHFQGAWLHPFDAGATQNAAFTLQSGEQVTVPMMEQVANLAYTEHAGLQAVELPYAEGALSMVILLPEEGAFDDVAGLSVQQLDAILGALAPASVRMALPRFSYQAGYELRGALTDLGMADAFGAAADFSGMDGSQELFVDQVYHQAFVDVDEAGTEATAASAVVMERKGQLQAGHEVRADRPFLFLIRDIETGAILFLGHVANPQA